MQLLFDDMVEIQSSAEMSMDHLPQSDTTTLLFLVCQVAAFTDYLFVSSLFTLSTIPILLSRIYSSFRRIVIQSGIFATLRHLLSSLANQSLKDGNLLRYVFHRAKIPSNLLFS